MNQFLRTVDVFCSGPLSGNPLAVVTGAEGVETADMLRLTQWFNLSETAFLLPPTEADADYRVRIFTLDRELPFAGHPTLGTCHAWLEAGGTPKREGMIVQQCGAGLVPIRQDAGRLLFAAPALLRSGPPDAEELDRCVELLGIPRDAIVDVSWIDNGPGWLGVRLASAQEVLALEPKRSWPGRIEIGVVGPHAAGGDAAFELRAFFTDHNGTVIEDPVTGSLNASVTQWLFATGVATGPYIAAQGSRLGREGRIFIDRDTSGQVWVGGNCRTIVEGRLRSL